MDTEEESAPASAAMCAVHEGAPARGTCERCGNFVCPLCLDPSAHLPGYCAECRERRGGGLIAWEREEGSWLARWWQTTREVIARPRATFAAARPGSVGAALQYVAVTGALMGAVVAVLGGCAVGILIAGGFLGSMSGSEAEASGFAAGLLVAVVLAYPIMIILAMLFSVSIRALVYHGAVALLGGKGGIGVSFWTMSYLHAVHVAFLPLALLQQIPFIGPFIGLIGFVGMESFMAAQLSHCARDHHGLEGGRATFAGWSVFLTWAVLGITCCLGAFAIGLALGFGRTIH